VHLYVAGKHTRGEQHGHRMNMLEALWGDEHTVSVCMSKENYSMLARRQSH